MLQVGGQPLDTADTSQAGYFPDDQSSDAFGHAAPFLADIDGDRARDLIVGSFSGRFRWYRNNGTDAAPVFPRLFSWIKGGDEIAKVPIYCCVASGPQLIDIDRDGIPDLTSGSYDPGAIYWFKGLGEGRFNQRHMLTSSGMPFFPSSTGGGPGTMSNVAWLDWNADGWLDMIMGNMGGELFVRLNQGNTLQAVAYTPLPSQPEFKTQRMQQLNDRVDELCIEGRSAVTERHAAPGVADWDGDGLWDILIGTHTGAVYWLKNTGKAGKPEFKTREQILPPGEGVWQWVEQGQLPKRGVRSQIHAVDYNLDGKLDLLVGDWSMTVTPRADLTSAQKSELKKLRAQLRALDSKVGYEGYDNRSYAAGYSKDDEAKALLKQAYELQKQLIPYLKDYGADGRTGETVLKPHGHVWVFLAR